MWTSICKYKYQKKILFIIFMFSTICGRPYFVEKQHPGKVLPRAASRPMHHISKTYRALNMPLPILKHCKSCISKKLKPFYCWCSCSTQRCLHRVTSTSGSRPAAATPSGGWSSYYLRRWWTAWSTSAPPWSITKSRSCCARFSVPSSSSSQVSFFFCVWKLFFLIKKKV